MSLNWWFKHFVKDKKLFDKIVHQYEKFDYFYANICLKYKFFEKGFYDN